MNRCSKITGTTRKAEWWGSQESKTWVLDLMNEAGENVYWTFYPNGTIVYSDVS